MKSLSKKVAKKYKIDHKVLKYFIKEEGINKKQITRLQLLEILYINCTDLFYTRIDKNSNIVEFLNKDIMKILISEINELKDISNG